MSITIPTCPPPCAISNVALMGMASCNGNNAEFTITFDVTNGSGDYELINTSNSNAVIGTITGGVATGTGLSITGSIPNTTAGMININVWDANENTCIGINQTISIPTCPTAMCSISNISTADVTCINQMEFTTDITVTFSTPPTTGNLQVDIGAGSTASIPVGSITGFSHTFMNVQGMSGQGTVNITASFTADPSCVLVSSFLTPDCSCPANLATSTADPIGVNNLSLIHI